MFRKCDFTILLILSVLTLSSCNRGNNEGLAPAVDNQAVKPPTAETTASSSVKTQETPAEYQVVTKSFTDREIKVDYPQIANLGDNGKQDKINKTIKEEALKVLNYYQDPEEDFRSKLSLEIGYDIKLKTAKVLSIQYSGTGNVEGAAHPNRLFLHHEYRYRYRKPV